MLVALLLLHLAHSILQSLLQSLLLLQLPRWLAWYHVWPQAALPEILLAWSHHSPHLPVIQPMWTLQLTCPSAYFHPLLDPLIVIRMPLGKVLTSQVCFLMRKLQQVITMIKATNATPRAIAASAPDYSSIPNSLLGINAWCIHPPHWSPHHTGFTGWVTLQINSGWCECLSAKRVTFTLSHPSTLVMFSHCYNHNKLFIPIYDDVWW